MHEGSAKDERRKPHPALPKYLRDLGREKPTSEPIGAYWGLLGPIGASWPQISRWRLVPFALLGDATRKNTEYMCANAASARDERRMSEG